MEFCFERYVYDVNKKALGLFYQCGEEKFIHIIEFPNSINIAKLKEEEKIALDRAFFYIHLAEGINYYKAYLTDEVNHPILTQEEAEFFNTYYLNCLGELCFKNKKELPKEVFKSEKDKTRKKINYSTKDGVAVLIGGGKDSITSLEMLEHFDSKLLSVITSKDRSIPIAIKDVMSIAGKENILIYRHLSPNLFKLKNVYNGHSPITGNIAFINIASSILYGFNNIILSSERSANCGNIEWRDKEINHQWSKCFEFEKMFNLFIKSNINEELNYFSFLKPLSEIHIAKIFSNFTKYHHNFISCNQAFKVNNREQKWCCECSKCHFVFLILAPFMDNLEEIFGKNILDDESNIDEYKALIGLSEHKPFACIGEYEEAILAFKMLQDSTYRDCKVVIEINKLIDEMNINLQKIAKEQFTPSNEHLIPDEFFKEFIKWL